MISQSSSLAAKTWPLSAETSENGRSVEPAERRADAFAAVARAALAAGFDTTTDGGRPEVVVHVDAEVLADPAAAGRAHLENGPAVSAETCRRIACDAGMVVMSHGPDGSVLDVGRRTRKISSVRRPTLIP